MLKVPEAIGVNIAVVVSTPQIVPFTSWKGLGIAITASEKDATESPAPLVMCAGKSTKPITFALSPKEALSACTTGNELKRNKRVVVVCNMLLVARDALVR